MSRTPIGPDTLLFGDCIEWLRRIPSNTFSACVSDPPYGLEFMGKDWDAPWKDMGWQAGGGFSKPGIGERKTDWPSFSSTNRFGNTNPTCAKCGGRARGAKKCSCDEPDWKPIGKRRNPENEGLPDDMTGGGMAEQMRGFQQWCELWSREVLRVLKPGGHLLTFGGTRTYHRMVCGIEEAGFQIRDMIDYDCELVDYHSWMYGQGFPKSLNIGKAIDKSEKGHPQGGPDPTSPNHGKFKGGCDGENPTGRGFGAGPGQFMKPEGGMDDSDLDDETDPEDELEPTIEEGEGFSEVAGKWKGYGTALKPAHEPVAIFGKGTGSLPEHLVPFTYTPKVSTRERNLGCKNLFWLMEEGENRPITKKQYIAFRDENKEKKGQDGFTPHPIRRGNIWPCLHPDSFVVTSEGMVRISDVGVGDLVYSHDGKYHKVTDAFSKPCPVLYRISVRGCNADVLASDNHPFLVWRPVRSKKGAIRSGKVMWVKASEMEVGDYTMTPVSTMGKMGGSPDDLMWVIGLWLAEGSILKAGHGDNVYPVWSLSGDERDLVDRIRSVTNCKVSVYEKKDCNGISVVAFDTELGEKCIRLCGIKAGGKRVSSDVFEMSYGARTSFLQGYIQGDGSLEANDTRAKTVSESLSYQLKLLAESVGFYATCNRYEQKTRKIGTRIFKNVRPVWRLRFTEKNILGTGKRRTKPTAVEHDGVIYTLQYVKGVEREDYDGEVVNLTVDGAQTFQTSVGMSHNTVKPIDVHGQWHDAVCLYS